MAEESEKRDYREEPFPDHDVIEISISINDDIVIEDELHHRNFIGKEELEFSNVDLVEVEAEMAFEAILEEYKRRRDGGGDG